ncbi:MAG TPA: hypothetical protein VEL74_23885 [Thermoanaerobaculia bacterium]|nr:hypothetical protein [Thermoanaerobaculia bacterium]
MTVLRCYIFILFAGWLLLAAPPARSQELPAEGLQPEELQAEEPASFLLETITVEGAQPAAAHIVRAESLLEEGRTYTEEELRQAVYRIQRLPIVLETSFALRKGGTRGAYELVIQVRQARRFFYEHGARVSFFRSDLALNEIRGEETTFGASGLVGLRQFVGRTGVLVGALDTARGAQVGYSQYDLFGRGIVASVAYSWIPNVTEVLSYGLDPGFIAWDVDEQNRLTFNLAVPLDASQSFQLGFSDRRGDTGQRRRILEPDLTESLRPEGSLRADELAEQRLVARWVYDTSDDPLLPTRGLSLSGGIEAASLTLRGLERFRFVQDASGFRDELIPQPDYEAETVSAVFTAARHWPVTPRQTVSVSGRASAGRSWLENAQIPGDPVAFVQEDLDVNVYGLSAGVRHAVRLWSGRQPRGFGDLSLESAVEAGRETTSPDLSLATTPLTRLEVSTGLVFRHQWGVLRFHLAYLDFREDER